MGIPVNPNLSLAYRIPGTYVYIDPNAPGAGQVDIRQRVLILAERDTAAPSALPANSIYQALNSTTVNANSGQRSTAARMARALFAQVGAGNVDAWVCHVDPPSGGAASQYTVVVSGTATAPGTLTMWVCGAPVSVSFVTGDAAATVASALKAQLDGLSDTPLTWGLSSATLTGTYSHKGLIGNDCPMRFSVTPSSGIQVGPGSLTVANIAAGAGSATLTCGNTVYTASVIDTQAASATATALATAITSGPLVAGTVASGTIPIYFANGYDVRQVSAAIVTSTVQTVSFNGGTAGATAVAGVAGSGTVTLTAAIAAISVQAGYAQWCVPWTDTTTLSTLATEIELEGNGLNCKGQKLTLCTVGSETAASGIPIATTPTLSTSLRYTVGWLQDAPQQGYEYAVRMAGVRALRGLTPAANYDATAMVTNSTVPLLQPPVSARALKSDLSAAINAGITPLAFNEIAGATVIVFGRTTMLSSDRQLHDWSCIDQLDWQRVEIQLDFGVTFKGVMFKVLGDSFSPDVVNTNAIEDRMYSLTVQWERRGVFDSAEAVKGDIHARQNASDAGRIDLVYTATVLTPIHQISVYESRGTVSAA